MLRRTPGERGYIAADLTDQVIYSAEIRGADLLDDRNRYLRAHLWTRGGEVRLDWTSPVQELEAEGWTRVRPIEEAGRLFAFVPPPAQGEDAEDVEP